MRQLLRQHGRPLLGRPLLGRPLREVVPESLEQTLRSVYQDALADQDNKIIEVHLPTIASSLVSRFRVHVVPDGDRVHLHFDGASTQYLERKVRDDATRRWQRIFDLSSRLSTAVNVEQLLQIVTRELLPELGCNVGAAAEFREGDFSTFACHAASHHGTGMHACGDGCWVHSVINHAVRGTPPVLRENSDIVLLPDRRACLTLGASMPRVLAVTGSSSFALLPLTAGGISMGVVVAGWFGAQDFNRNQVHMLRWLATRCAQTLHRMQAHVLERETTAQTAGMSRALQRSLLPDLPHLPAVELAARYAAAGKGAHVGGDWFDVFSAGDGSTYFVIGDVCGHDQQAAVSMAQIRNVLRGVAHAVVGPPARVLDCLDAALRDLAVETTATAVIATLQPAPVPQGGREGFRVLHWASAGHLPLLLLDPNTGAQMLQRSADLMLGLGLGDRYVRSDHRQLVSPGSTILLFTDGLVERRGEDLDVGLRRVVALADSLAHRPLAQLCDEVMTGLADGRDDDVALLGLRTRGGESHLIGADNLFH